MLLVVVLMGLLAGMAGLSVSGDTTRHNREEAERLLQVLQMAADEAVIQGVEIGATFTPRSYGFLRYDNTSRAWLPLEGKSFRNRVLPDDVVLGLTLTSAPISLADVAKMRGHPAVLFLSSGETTAFTLTVSHTDHSGVLVLGTDGISPLSIQGDRP